MDRTLPKPLDWRSRLLWVLGASVFAVNLVLVGFTVYALIIDGGGFDWRIYVEASTRLQDGLYAVESGSYVFRYSPLFALLMVPLSAIGFWGWTVLHFAALLLLPRFVALVAVVSWPFWDDVYNGNLMTFVFVAGWLAMKGNRWGTVAFLVLVVLVPRPLMLPVLGWVLWNRREWFVPFSAIVFTSLLGAWMTGWLDEWVVSLVTVGNDLDYGPRQWLGVWWIPVGAVLAVWLTIKGWVGAASLAASPYWLPPYLLVLLLDLRRFTSRSTAPPPTARTAGRWR